jgi:hypothetical protein
MGQNKKRTRISGGCSRRPRPNMERQCVHNRTHGKWPGATAQWPPVAGKTRPVQGSQAWNAGTFVARHEEDGRAQWSQAQRPARHDVDGQVQWPTWHGKAAATAGWAQNVDKSRWGRSGEKKCLTKRKRAGTWD